MGRGRRCIGFRSIGFVITFNEFLNDLLFTLIPIEILQVDEE